jgi:hypothetical protein
MEFLKVKRGKGVSINEWPMILTINKVQKMASGVSGI